MNKFILEKLNCGKFVLAPPNVQTHFRLCKASIIKYEGLPKVESGLETHCPPSVKVLCFANLGGEKQTLKIHCDY